MATSPYPNTTRSAVGAVSVRSVERALKILQAYSSDELELSLSDLGRRLELSLNTRHLTVSVLPATSLLENSCKSLVSLGLT